jgi:DNA-3-methyladenine glycosylase
VAKLPRSFFARRTEEVAADLLGCVLVRSIPGALLSGSIVETEAYGGADDPGSHAFRGRTRRNSVMFGPPGYLYVYRSYGIHSCLNVVCEREGAAGAVLIRALQPISGIGIMERNRGGRPVADLCNGPGKLCAALDITTALNGADLEGDQVWIEEGQRPEKVETTTRIGLTGGADLPLRFVVTGSPFASRRRKVGAR